jgi:GntR family transcriptional repressor for pyruvate dehydrogenase complex
MAQSEAAADEGDREALDAADIGFHLAIVRATHNPLLVNILDTFQSLMWSSHGIRTVILEAADYRLVSKEHGAIASAIRARVPERARDAMVEHIDMIRLRVQRLQARTRAGDGLDHRG